MTGVSIKPSEMVEGGAVPVDMNLTWKECRFSLWDYRGKAKLTTAARINYVSDEGSEYEQYYSVGDPERFIPSEDGKTLVQVGAAEAVSKSSNFYILMNALVNAGFPENRLSGDISALDGLYTYNIGIPAPKRAGLRRGVEEGAREPILSVPSQVHKLPGEKKASSAKAGAKAVAEAGEDEGDADAVEAAALKFVGTIIKSGDTVTRQGLAVKLFKDLANDPNKDAIADLIYKPEFAVALLKAGYTVDGENISKA